MMKAVSFKEDSTSDLTNPLIDIDIDTPTLQSKDLLVKIHAISVNPVDTKVRKKQIPIQDKNRILGWDAVGEVIEIGADVQNFNIGDTVWYAGDLTRSGSNAELQAVDERIVSLAPKSISYEEAAALPLTALTAWEMLFDRFEINENEHESILIIGGAGGVGSIAIQLLKAKTNLTIIATASRPETREWVTSLGADYVINHHQNLDEQIKNLGIEAPKYVFSTNASADYIEQIATLIAPQGKFGLIDDPESLNIIPLKAKSTSIHWELMFTRSMFNTADISKQHEILKNLAQLVDEKKVRSTLDQSLGQISALNLTKAHQLIESGQARGKVVLTGF